MIRTFKSTGIGNEIPFDAEEARRRWRRLKEESRRAFEERRHSGAPSPRTLRGKPGGTGDGDGGEIST